MEENKVSLTALSKRINLLIDLHRNSQKQVNRLVQERDDLVLQIGALEKENRQLHQENEALKIASSMPVEQEDRQEMKKRVKELMKEVDDCIALLNK